MTKEDAAAILWGVQAHTATGNSIEYSDKLQSAMALAINALNAPNTLETLETLKRVSKAYEQCAWERDIAIGQLRELGYGLGEKIRTDSDTISRQAAIDAVLDRMDVEKHGRDAKPEEIQWTLEKLPSAQPEIVHCEECAYRKDNFMGDWCTCWCGWTSLDGYCHKGANKDE